MNPGEPLGLIAGNGRLPLYVAREARRRGIRVVAVAHRGETLPEIDQAVESVTWVPVGALRRIARALRDAGVRRAIMAGGLGKARLLRDFRPDLAALGVLLSLRSHDDDALLRGIADYFDRQGVEVVDAAPLVPELYAPEGLIARRKPTRRELAEVNHGLRVAKALGGLDVGQTVAVKSGATVAVEAVEGTDELIRRAGALVGAGVVVVKASKPGQDLRFDVPAVGAQTVRVMAEMGATVLAVEAKRTLLLERAEIVEIADAHRIAVVGVSG
jgi:DUF1009 family protein